MKTKLLAEAVVLATLVAVMLSVGFVQAGNYRPYSSRSGAWGGWVIASNNIYFNDQTYAIDIGASSTDISDGIWAGGGLSRQEQRQSITTFNSEAYIRSDFYPLWSANYGMYAWAWTYPSYTQQPYGGSTGLWYI